MPDDELSVSLVLQMYNVNFSDSRQNRFHFHCTKHLSFQFNNYYLPDVFQVFAHFWWKFKQVLECKNDLLVPPNSLSFCFCFCLSLSNLTNYILLIWRFVILQINNNENTNWNSNRNWGSHLLSTCSILIGYFKVICILLISCD